MAKLNAGIIGCGAIGAQLARVIINDFSSGINLVSLYDIDPKRAEKLAGALQSRTMVEKSPAHLIKRVNLVIEAARASVSAEIVKSSLLFRKDVLVMSVGGLRDCAAEIFALAEKNKTRIFIPSGAICGIDGLKALRHSTISKVRLTTRKPALGLANNSYLNEKGIELDEIKVETVVFEGTAFEAVKFFPQNVNVAAVLSLAGIGFKETLVRIVAVPGSGANIHEIEIEADAAKLFIRAENKPHPDNPKTSSLAVLSAIETLRGILCNVRVGT